MELHREPLRARPPPYPAPDPFEPFAVAAVELADEGLIVLGKVVEGTLAADLKVGMEMELTTMPLYTDDDGVERIVYAVEDRSREHARTGLHPRRGHAPVGQVGPQLRRVRRGRRAGRAGRRRRWTGATSSSSPAPTPSATATPASSPAPTFAQALGWNGAPVSSSYAACATGVAGPRRAPAPRSSPGFCDVALVIGADTTPKGFLAPIGGERRDDPDWLRFRLLGATNPTYFALYARRRMDLYGATRDDFAAGQGEERPARPRQPERPLPQGSHRSTTCWPRPIVSDPLRLLDICATSDGAAALIVASRWSTPASTSARSTACRRCARSPRSRPRYPQTVHRAARLRHRLRRRRCPHRSGRSRTRSLDAAYEEAGIGPDDLDLAEVYDLSTALELDWYEHIGLCAKGEAEKLLRDGATTIGGRIPVNPSGGLACFGEAIPAQAIAQVCELTWQLRGQATGRQVEGAKVGVTANQGLFGHGSSVIVAR